jgi:hypothetical protein
MREMAPSDAARAWWRHQVAFGKDDFHLPRN